jgi:hypothetical protein
VLHTLYRDGEHFNSTLAIDLQKGTHIGVGPELNLPDHPAVYGLDDIAAITDATHQRSGRITTRDEEA